MLPSLDGLESSMKSMSLQRWSGGSSSTPGTSSTSMETDGAAPHRGGFTMREQDFGGTLETRRDAARTFLSGGISVLLEGELPVRLKEPTARPQQPSSPGGRVDAVAVDMHIDALTRAIRSSLPRLDISDAAIQRILPMLTVNPALLALSTVGLPPTLESHRVVLRATRTRELHCLTLGYVELEDSLCSSSSSAWSLLGRARTCLIVGSTDLLASASGQHAYELSYVLRRARRERLEDEVVEESQADALVGLEAAPAAADELFIGAGCQVVTVRREGRYVRRTIKDELCSGCHLCCPDD